jgi:hypothetical protein
MRHGLVGMNSLFGNNEAYSPSDPIIPYVKNADISTYGWVVVRVNPSNADLTKAQINLIDSRGNVLDVVEAGVPVKYDQLITRTTVNTGLWRIPFKVAGGQTLDSTAFKSATEYNGNDILYAISVNNTSGDSTRFVSTTWDVDPEYTAYSPVSSFDFSVDGKWAENIHNRWDGDSTRTEDAVKVSAIQEYQWAESTTNVVTPDTAAVITPAYVNVIKAGNTAENDARYSQALLAVEVNKPFTLQIADPVDATTKYADKIEYYYVTLDKKCAIESEPSEWNAWTGYTYEGLYKTVSSSKDLELTITDQSADGDIIGFRVYAVNYDGTLADPDGRAFYVQVGEAANTETVAANDTITTTNAGITSVATLSDTLQNTVVIPLTKSFASSTSNVSGTLTLDRATAGNLTGYADSTEFVYYKLLDKRMQPATNWNKAKYILLGVNDGSKWLDGTSLSGTIQAMYGGSTSTAPRVLNTLNVTITKVLPTSVNTVLSFLPYQGNQETGEFTLYMVPDSGWAATTTSASGAIDLDNTFYNLPENIVFTFANSAYYGNSVTSKKSGVATVYGYTESDNVIRVDADFIDSESWHNVTTSINYGQISTAHPGEDYVIALNQPLKARFACWESANTYEWGTRRDTTYDANGNIASINTVSLKPSLQWNAAGDYDSTLIATDIVVKNSYDAERFSGKFSKLIGTNHFLKVEGSKTTWGNPVQENPYVIPTYHENSGYITWESSQVENAPTQSHDENLEITVKDCYGHKRVISLQVWIERP